jgi:hypothetical protein
MKIYIVEGGKKLWYRYTLNGVPRFKPSEAQATEIHPEFAERIIRQLIRLSPDIQPLRSDRPEPTSD